MNYQETIQYIDSLRPTLGHLGIERIRTFFAKYNSPQNSFSTLHVAGTNGKGSTVAILDSILQASGLKVGRYTGPHLLKWNERIHVAGKAIDDAQFAQIATQLRELSESFGKDHPEFGALSWFEFLTALAFFFFAENKVDIAVIEVGLGGRFDATNVIEKPLAVGITNISYDHTHILGSTLEEIAFEKAGIIKSHVPVITAAAEPGLGVIKKKAEEMEAPLVHINETNFEFDSIKLSGPHQRTNALVAIEMLKRAGLFKLDAIQEGLKNVYWPGRFQILGSLIFDGAHNLAGAEALRGSLDEFCPEVPCHFVFACYGNKDGPAMLEVLLKSGDSLYISEIDSNREAYSKERLLSQVKKNGVQAATYETIEKAFEAAQGASKNSDRIIITGSFATLVSIMKKLGWKKVENGR